ncbi:MAG: hypothetical protein AAGE76_10885 [Pseudomonadota bacterium]
MTPAHDPDAPAGPVPIRTASARTALRAATRLAAANPAGTGTGTGSGRIPGFGDGAAPIPPDRRSACTARAPAVPPVPA